MTEENKIIFSHNFFTHNEKDIVDLPHIFNKISLSAIQKVVGKPKHISEIGFDVKVMIKKLRLKENKTRGYSNFDFSSGINEKSAEYLKKYLNDKIFICFELQKEVTEILNQIGITYINIWNHPFKLLDDLALTIETNNKDIYKNTLKYQIPQDKFDLYAKYWAQRISSMSSFCQINKKLSPDSLLIIGQSEIDKSLQKEDQMLSLNSFQEKINRYKKQYNKVYYSPHPNLIKSRGRLKFKKNPEFKKFIKNNPDIEIINKPTYKLLTSDKIKKVIAISSSVLFEAKFFDKEIEYLYQPLFKFDTDNPKHGVSIDSKEIFFPHFWSEILSPIIKNKKDIKHVSFDNHSNKTRWL
ncbi:MAG: hypothetical protein O3B09_03380, partial [Proteobacteria bacterium]|nr:hypothetical protein [Pseudomonadota bacterium]